MDRQEKTEGAENRPPVISINGQTIIGSRNEDILSAALQEGLDFPHSCRVGGCAACKCRLIEGKVKELTETGYLLTEEELNSGYILACQSIPETDLKI
ncbi:MAG TPA: 2Fe-2S iron-sulfur cluster binding domain-containing protein, partial [Leptospiraceae bacterium]|nr:2Fe-2S iron-sulfur cluster binding domain-containing protein [Leptospiraceae bacterium]